MTLFAAQTVAVGGLNAQAAKIGNISDDVSNTSTIAFKSIGTDFESQVTQSSVSYNNPGGVRAKPRYNNDIQGNIVSSSAATSLAISGQGFFSVKRAGLDTQGAPVFGSDTYFTRVGNFSLDKDGYLVNGAGYYLSGYEVDANGNVVNNSVTKPVQIASLLDNPERTTAVNYNANLPSGVANAYTTEPSQIPIYDYLGQPHTMSLTWQKTGTSTWGLAISVPDSSPAYSATIPFTFNQTPSASPGTLDSIAADTATPAKWTVDPSATEAAISFNATFLGSGVQTIKVNFGQYDSSLNSLTQFSSEKIVVNKLEQNGIPRGAFQRLTVNKEGFVALNYDNGRVRTVSQIPVVQFFAANQLQRITGGVFAQTEASGTPRYSTAGSNGAGSLVPNALEASNVDIAEEYTKMIEAQRVYSANAKVVSTADEMLQIVEQVKR